MPVVGTILGGSLRLERLAGVGGMGEVFEARDLNSGQRVAVKVLCCSQLDPMVRFEREVRILAELDHPNIVRYLDHGIALLGQPYLVMEWLDGEDLAARLRRGPLTVHETLAIGRDVAEALAATHARGIIHRDLEPGNVFLTRGAPGPSKVLGFGVAQLGGRTPVTPTGARLGGYLAPEQARRRANPTPAADVFSLGCVLFECLAGRPVFAGEHPVAAIDEVLTSTLPSLTRLRPNVPAELAALIQRMLAREPAQRPCDGAAVRAALVALAASQALGGEPEAMLPHLPGAPLTQREQRLLSVVLIAPPGGEDHAAISENRRMLAAADDATELARLRRAADAHGGYCEAWSDGTVLVAISGTQIATDQAALSARCALALRAEASGRRMALAMGHDDRSARGPGKAAIDRAAGTLARCSGAVPEGKDRETGNDRPLPIAIDEVVAGLLDGRFEVHEGAAGFELHGERAATPGTRRLLGRATSCVGRDVELSTLVGLFADCTGESVAHAVLVTAPAGMGKSRLVAELMVVLEARHDAPVCWVGRGDPLRGGLAFGLLRQALQGALGLHDGDPLAVRQDLLRSGVARHVPEAERPRVTEFLGELLGTPFPDDDSAPLRAARQEAAVMSEQMRRAAEAFLEAACAAHPVLLVLEDLHWGDLSTVRFIDAALRDLKELPWMVLALARPEVHQLFPQLWAKRGAQEIRLHPLGRSSSERLVRQVLGAEVDPTTMARLVAQAEGNPFYLEELIRAVAERKDEALPETVVAMVHARLGRLLDDERRLLRAASVFGEVFWSGGVAALLGGGPPAPAIHTWLEALVERELLVRRPDSRFPGMEELTFCHALLREGAYALLTQTDQIRGHRLAAAWLEHQGEGEPMVLAEHYDRGRAPAQAARWFFQAASRAMQAGDLEAAIERAGRALAHGLPDTERSVLFGVLAEVHCWRGEWEEATRWGEEGIALAAPGSHPWALAVTAKMAIALREGKIDTLIELFHLLHTVEPGRDAVIPIVAAVNFGCFFLSGLGRFALVERSVERIAALVEPIAAREPVARGWMHMSHVSIEPWAREDPWAGCRYAEAARASFLEANHRPNARLAQMMLGMNLWLVGALERAERELRGSVEDGAFFGPSASRHLSCLVGTLADRGKLDEAHEVASRMISAWQAQGLRVQESQGRGILAYVLFRGGKHAAAEREARVALERLIFLSVDKVAAMATLGAALLAQDRAAEALAVAEAVMGHYEALGAFGFRGAFARLVHAEALEATGDHAGARRAVITARARLQLQAARIDDVAVRRGFLEDLPDHARTLALARQWVGDEAGRSEAAGPRGRPAR